MYLALFNADGKETARITEVDGHLTGDTDLAKHIAEANDTRNRLDFYRRWGSRMTQDEIGKLIDDDGVQILLSPDGEKMMYDAATDKFVLKVAPEAPTNVEEGA